jgi:hypothetical protein
VGRGPPRPGPGEPLPRPPPRDDLPVAGLSEGRTGGLPPREPLSGRWKATVPVADVAAPLLAALQATARAAARTVLNDPRLDAHISRRTLHWVLNWNPDGSRSVRQWVAMQAANEARRIRAMRPGRERTVACGRSHDDPVIVRRFKPHGLARA